MEEQREGRINRGKGGGYDNSLFVREEQREGGINRGEGGKIR